MNSLNHELTKLTDSGSKENPYGIDLKIIYKPIMKNGYEDLIGGNGSVFCQITPIQYNSCFCTVACKK